MPFSFHSIFWYVHNLVKSPDSLGNHLNNLLREAENRIHELSGMDDIPQAPFSTRASFSSIIGKLASIFFLIAQWLLNFSSPPLHQTSTRITIYTRFIFQFSIILTC